MTPEQQIATKTESIVRITARLSQARSFFERQFTFAQIQRAITDSFEFVVTSSNYYENRGHIVGAKACAGFFQNPLNNRVLLVEKPIDDVISELSFEINFRKSYDPEIQGIWLHRLAELGVNVVSIYGPPEKTSEYFYRENIPIEKAIEVVDPD